VDMVSRFNDSFSSAHPGEHRNCPVCKPTVWGGGSTRLLVTKANLVWSKTFWENRCILSTVQNVEIHWKFIGLHTGTLGTKKSSLSISLNQSIIQFNVRFSMLAQVGWSDLQHFLHASSPTGRTRRTPHLPPPLFTHGTMIGRSMALIGRNRPTGTRRGNAAGPLWAV